MPMYTQYCFQCDLAKIYISTIDERDSKRCANCNSPMQRMIDKPGMVWAPTASSGASHK